MSKKYLIIIPIILLIIILGIVVYKELNSQEQSEPNTIINSFEGQEVNFSSEDIISLAKTSSLYDKEVNLSSKPNEIIMSYQDETINILIKESQYLVNIPNDSSHYEQFINTFGAIVDATQVKNGMTLGEYNETYQKIINQEIILDGTRANIDEHSTQLIFQYNTQLELYTPPKTYSYNELISLNSGNIEIKLDNLTLNRITSGYSEHTKLFTICGYAINPSSITSNLTINLNFNDKQTLISTTEIKNQKISNFCVSYDLTNYNKDNITSYQIVK